MCAGFWVGSLFGILYARTLHLGYVDVCAAVVSFAFGVSLLSHMATWWLRSKGYFTEPEHDGWRYGPNGTYEELD